MGALRAIITDTWRQSRQQVVFMIMIGLLLILAIVPVVLAKPMVIENEAGEQVEHVTILGYEGSEEALETAWAAAYGQSVMMTTDGEQPDPFSPEGQKMQEELLEIAELEANTPPKQRGVEAFVMIVSGFVFSVSMMLFIAASAGYFPSMLEAGAIDIVLAKPLERWKVYLGKYLGGLALFTAAIVGAYMILFVGLGVRTGVWHPAIFLVMPLQLVAAATLFALLALIGVVSRSSTLCMILGFVYYLVVDSVLSVLMIVPFDIPWLETTQKVIRWTIPNFDQIKSAATLSVINMPAMNWQPVAVACAWIVLSLGLGYWKFKRTDY